MNLQCVTIQGFRRFVKPTSIRLNERLIAIVGPNEAGKSSVLRALVQAGTDAPFDTKDCPRDRDETTQITMVFLVTDEDRLAMEGIAGAAELRRCRIVKKMDGKPVLTLEPQPAHDLRSRQTLLATLSAQTTTNLMGGFGNTNEERQQRIQRLLTATSTLNSDADYLGLGALGHLRLLLNADFSPLANNPKTAETDRSAAQQISESMTALIKHEESSAPEKIRQILLRRRPPILFFDEAARDLKSSYELNSVATNPPPALAHLCTLCDLNLQALLKAATDKVIYRRDQILEAANKRLRERFEASWVRRDVVPHLSQDGRTLYINVRVEGGTAISPIDERSDGLRWFIALLAFLCGRASEEKPVLLTDEAETHLSYDAQASLVDVLELQEVAQKVIYTTHSAGCLPSDLGSGVRSVLPLRNGESELSNSFWSHGPGFTPLLLSMGLGPFAFTVARNVLIAEGPSECLLLPSLIREATELPQLRYQVAPGASTVSGAGVEDLISQSGRGAFVLDGDDAGEAIREKLLEAGIAKERMKTYRDLSGLPLILEDLVQPEAYVKAFNAELHLWQGAAHALTVADLGVANWTTAAEQWCEAKQLKPVGKIYVCQTLAEAAARGEKLLRPESKKILVELHEWAMAHFHKSGG